MKDNISQERKFPRFKGVERTFVLVPKNQEALPFHIVDVSEGGLSYRYLGTQLSCPHIEKVDLYHESEMVAEGIPVKPVSDNRLPNNMIPLRRVSFCFEALNTKQKNQVQSFIDAFTEQSS